MFSQSKWAIALGVFGSAVMVTSNQAALAGGWSNPSTYKHVLILSVDGLHQADVADPLLQSDLPNIISLEKTGVSYTNASTSKPSDSFPGTTAYLTGASPGTTGIYYDVSYNRSLTAPGGNAASPRGTLVPYDESIDYDPTLLSGGGDYSVGSIDPAKLPLDCTSGTCKPVYPHSYLKVNTIFNVAKEAGLYTAFSDKHPAYDLANGPSGNGVDDLFAPEIAANVAIENGKLVDSSTAQNPGALTFKVVTGSLDTVEAYDDLKVNAIINEINGKNSLATKSAPVPAIFGMNFQAVSIAEKAKAGGIDVAADGTEKPSAELNAALAHTDASIGQMVAALKQNNLFDSTLVIVLAKHGQSPRLGSATLVKDTLIPDALQAAGIEVAQATQDDVSLFWLKDQTQASKAAQVIQGLQNQSQACGGTIQQNCNPGIDNVYYGAGLVQAGFGIPYSSRTPDLIVKVKTGIIFVGNLQSTVKRQEHGGLNPDDLHVPLIIGSGGLPSNLKGTTQNEDVATKQVAVTTLEALGLNPYLLRGADIEHTQALPGLSINFPSGYYGR